MKPTPRRNSELKRRPFSRKPFERILIVCEGEKTEPNYFEEIKKKFRLPTTNIRITNNPNGTSPKQLIEYTDLLFSRENKAFDRIYIVFDRDSHITYKNALDMVQARNDAKKRNDFKKPVKFFAIASVPCFETWLLFHFSRKSGPANRFDILKELRNSFTNARLGEYDKNRNDLYRVLQDRLLEAKSHAKNIQKSVRRDTGDSIYTDVHELVDYLENIKP